MLPSNRGRSTACPAALTSPLASLLASPSSGRTTGAARCAGTRRSRQRLRTPSRAPYAMRPWLDLPLLHLRPARPLQALAAGPVDRLVAKLQAPQQHRSPQQMRQEGVRQVRHRHSQLLHRQRAKNSLLLPQQLLCWERPNCGVSVSCITGSLAEQTSRGRQC
jgi:hypothetical protein